MIQILERRLAKSLPDKQRRQTVKKHWIAIVLVLVALACFGVSVVSQAAYHPGPVSASADEPGTIAAFGLPQLFSLLGGSSLVSAVFTWLSNRVQGMPDGWAKRLSGYGVEIGRIGSYAALYKASKNKEERAHNRSAAKTEYDQNFELMFPIDPAIDGKPGV